MDLNRSINGVLLVTLRAPCVDVTEAGAPVEPELLAHVQDLLTHVAGLPCYRCDADLAFMLETGWTEAAARQLADRLLLQVDAFQMEVAPDELGAMIGISCGAGGQLSAAIHLERARSAIQRGIYEDQPGVCVWQPERQVQASANLVLAGQLRQGLGMRQFETYYQPQVDCRDGSVVGLEALLRWRHPNLGVVMPGQFLSVAERSGLIKHIGEWVLHNACLQYRHWLDLGLAPGRLSINLSPSHLADTDAVVRQAWTALADTCLEPGNIEIEMTETVEIQYPKEVRDTLAALADLGMRIAIDDFGSGHANMDYLTRFPLHTIKLDRSLIQSMVDDHRAGVVVSSLLGMAADLGLDVVAEGVETHAQSEFLRERNCTVQQGWHFCQALPARLVPGYMASRGRRPGAVAAAGSLAAGGRVLHGALRKPVV